MEDQRWHAGLSCVSLLRTGMLCALAFFFLGTAHAQTRGADDSFHDRTQTPPKVLRVVMDDNYPPYIFRDKSGQLQGILKDKWALWSKVTSVPVKIHATDWLVAQEIMRSGQADVLDTAFRTEDRETYLRFSKPYALLETVIFFHKSVSGIRGVADLQGFAVGVKKGGATTRWLGTQGVTSLREYPSYQSIVEAALRDEIRVFCMEKTPALYFLYKNGKWGDFRQTDKLYAGQFHWATLKGANGLHRFVERGFDQVGPAALGRIEEKWKGTPLSESIEFQYIKYIIVTLLIVLGVVAAQLLLNWTLRKKVRTKTAELSETLEALGTSERYNRMLFESTMIGLMLCRLDGSIADANQAYADIIGYTPDETLQLTTMDFTLDEGEDKKQAELKTLLEKGEYGPIDKVYIKKSGERVAVRVMETLIDRGAEPYILCSVEDVTEKKASEARVQFLAFNDPLTALPNRLYAQEHFMRQVPEADRRRRKLALIQMDLDNFKNINDSLGHATGDSLLKAAATRLVGCLDARALISRQGGDEFLIVLPDVLDEEKITTLIADIMACMREPFEIEGNEMTTTLSMGIAIYPDDGRDFETLMRNADIAMYQAKDSGRNGYCFFDEAMHQKAFERLSLGSGLRRALERNELLLYYQPFVEIQSRKLIGAEALLRWQHPEQGLLAPDKFIPTAEDTGLIVPIGEWVIQEACRQMASLQCESKPPLQIAVNLSAVQFRRNDLEKTVKQALEMTRLDPVLLELELTESILLSNADSVLQTVSQLKQLGVRFSIDDFGTGYSSLSYLKRFAVNKLKIDRSFVQNVTKDADDAAIVRAIIQMAKNLGLETLAEGVEDEPTLQWLLACGCDFAQGYYFAKPMRAARFADYLAQS